MDPKIYTPRLRLTLLTDSSEGSEQLAWFHRLWSDEVATGWSIRGRTKSYSESQDLMKKLLTEFSNIMYAVHTPITSTASTPDSLRNPTDEKDWRILGITGLRKSDSVMLPIPAPPSPFPASEAVEIRTLGYFFLEEAWGKGYASEANVALLKEYARAEGEEGKALKYVEAGVHAENPASVRVLEKIGLEKVGVAVWDDVFLAGKWRDGRCQVYGKYM